MQNTQTSLTLSTAKKSTSRKSELPQVDRKWLDAAFTKGKHERFSVIATITPAIAREMLTHNIGNRTPSRRQIDLHIHHLKNGEWVLTHHGIAFADTGVLNDGQHRLIAIAESGIPAQMQVTFGASRQEFLAIDGGKARTVANMLQISGRTHSNLRASLAAALVYRIDQTRVHDRQYVYEYAMQLDDAVFIPAAQLGSNMATYGFAPTWPMLGYWWIATRSRKAEKLPEFIKGLPSGEELSGPRLTLRNAVLRGDTYPASSSGRTRTVANASAMVQAWNAWCKGRPKVKFIGLSDLPEPV